jgi:two-component sensor histidine kinase
MQVMVAELQHRTRNLIAVIHALASKTLARSGSLAEFGERFGARLQALARANGLLSRLEEGERITFDALIQAELSALGVYDPERQGVQVVLDGPAGIRLRSGTVQIFALALHELATNALKYGALSASEGRLVVRWRSERGEAGQLRLRVDWEESGVRMPPDLATTGRRGHGRELIERALPFQLKARTRYTVGADGIRCTIDLPVSSEQGGGGPREGRHAAARPAAWSSPAGGGG